MQVPGLRLIADFVPGVPDLSSFPRADWAWAVKEACGAVASADLGYGDLTASAWFGLLLKSGTPDDVVRRLEAAAIAAHADPAVRAKLEAQGFEVSGETGAAFSDSIDAQFERWAKIVKATGFSAD